MRVVVSWCVVKGVVEVRVANRAALAVHEFTLDMLMVGGVV